MISAITYPQFSPQHFLNFLPDPANEIAACATEQNADLVVVGHSDKGAIARWFEASVGEGLLRDLPGNLLVATV